jgi:hypothetical protein
VAKLCLKTQSVGFEALLCEPYQCNANRIVREVSHRFLPFTRSDRILHHTLFFTMARAIFYFWTSRLAVRLGIHSLFVAANSCGVGWVGQLLAFAAPKPQ